MELMTLQPVMTMSWSRRRKGCLRHRAVWWRLAEPVLADYIGTSSEGGSERRGYDRAGRQIAAAPPDWKGAAARIHTHHAAASTGSESRRHRPDCSVTRHDGGQQDLAASDRSPQIWWLLSIPLPCLTFVLEYTRPLRDITKRHHQRASRRGREREGGREGRTERETRRDLGSRCLILIVRASDVNTVAR